MTHIPGCVTCGRPESDPRHHGGSIDEGHDYVPADPIPTIKLTEADVQRSTRDLHGPPPFVQTVERDVVIERRTELMGVWPNDPQTQRAWAVDRASAGLSGTLSQPTAADLIERADQILAYVLGES